MKVNIAGKLFYLALGLVFCVAFVPLVAAASCSIVGQWDWNTAQDPAPPGTWVIDFHEDGTLYYDGTYYGTWQLMSENPQVYYLSWTHGYYDTLTMSSDCQMLDGYNQNGLHVYAYRRSTNQPPVADFEATPTSGSAPLKITFTDKSTGDGITSRVWQYKLNSDSTWTTFTLDGTSSFTFTNAGSYDVKLTVTGTGGSDDEIKTITVNNQPLVAAFTYSPTNPVIGQEITFTAAQDPVNPIQKYSWDFKDGIGQGQQTTHIYKKVGWYSVNLLVINYQGQTNSVTKLVEVKPKVAISGDTSAILQMDSKGVITSPPIKLSAEVKPNGGIFSWSVINGQDKVTIVSVTNAKMFTLKGVKPSVPPGEDIEVKVIYVYDGVTNEATIKLTMRKPNELMIYNIGNPILKQNRKGDILDYKVSYWYYINDQMGTYIRAKLNSKEYWSKVISNVPTDKDEFTLIDSTNKYGILEDLLSPGDLNGPLPKNLLTRFQQTIWINGFQIDQRCLEYKYSGATSTRGICSTIP